ncbi:SURF1 family protein [Parahaliea maris]|uniref:SURF1-like protein n=1 Tax=Parahaliea maris TaxID=2716870 RepID=A0A5C9A1A8_9GAMM|nr:SURF1 family protein [Parahaliea maris]TXS93692.1 SURF1 family protein [Parahaliea maris]
MARQPLRLDLEWRTTLFTLVLLPVLVSLGFWQLQRAEEKRELAAMFAERQAQAPAPLEQLWGLSPDQLAYRPALLTGEFDPDHYLLLDNRIHQGQFGYEVIALLRLPDGERAVWVNRGWVAGDPARRSLPGVVQPAGTQRIHGAIYVAPGEAYLLGEQQLTGDWPIVLQSMEEEAAEVLGQRLGVSLFPWTVRIESTEPAALMADWPLVNISPAKHIGYAVQWFCMALALLILFVLRSSNLWQWLRRREPMEN